MKSLYASLWQPPDEDALVIKITRGCSYNECSFCALYKDRDYQVLDINEIRKTIARIPARDVDELTAIFLGEGNGLSAGMAPLKKVLTHIRETLPAVRRIGINATAMDVIKKRPQYMRDLRKAGLTNIYMGVESGDRQSLEAMNKGIDPEQVIKAGRRVMDAGITLSVSILLGAGGRRNKKRHIEGTAAVLGEINPSFIAIQTLTLMPGTPLFHLVKRGEYAHPTPIESTIEMRGLIGALELKGSFLHSDHPSNSVSLAGYLPDEKTELLNKLDRALNNPTDEFLTTDYFHRGI